MAYSFKSHLTVDDVIIYAYDSRGNWIEEFEGNPNRPMIELHDAILADVRAWMKERSTLSSVVDDAVMQVHFLFSAIIKDAEKSGTWMDANQLWNLEAWRVVNMANAVRAA